MSTTAAIAGTPGVAPLGAAPATRVQRRWQILSEQIQCGHEPCFQTERRHWCGEHACVWRAECLSLRAEWRR